MTATIDTLAQISRRCISDSDPELRWLGQSLNGYLTRRWRSVDEALGLLSPPGGVPMWLEYAMRKRNAALRELAERHFTAMSVSSQARQIHMRAIRYAASAWQRDRERNAMPEYYAGSVSAHLYIAFATGAPMPIGERQLRHILGR